MRDLESPREALRNEGESARRRSAVLVNGDEARQTGSQPSWVAVLLEDVRFLKQQHVCAAPGAVVEVNRRVCGAFVEVRLSNLIFGTEGLGDQPLPLLCL